MVIADLIKFPIWEEAERSTGKKVLLTKVRLDDQDLDVVVDTASSWTFFIWKNWYERKHPGGCNNIIYDCYQCKTPCKEGIPMEVPFADKSVVYVFIHSGNLALPGMVTTEVNFGLISGVGDHTTPFSALGLGPLLDKRYVPIIDQLLSKPPPERPITSSAFAVYLRNGDKPTGGLIIGGDDTSVHKKLFYMAVVVDDW